MPATTIWPAIRSSVSPRAPSPAPTICCSRLDSPTGSPLVADLEEYALGTVCFAVPISWGDRLGSLGVSLPVARLARLARLDPHRELFRTHLVPTANRVSRHLSLTI